MNKGCSFSKPGRVKRLIRNISGDQTLRREGDRKTREMNLDP